VSAKTWLHDLYRHQAWADAEHWRAIGAFDTARNDAVIRTRLHHIHLVQHAFEWSVGDRAAPLQLTTPAQFPSFESLRDYARAFHARVEPYFDALTDARASTSIRMKWFKDPPLSITVAEALTQCVMHSQHHRGQNAARLRELGGEPPTTDYIFWLWKGRPAPTW
jgi:uncharacterized damage-inducible protein DinB